MPIETECKFAVASHEQVRRALRAAAAACEGRVLEINRIFDRTDGSLRAAGCGLRLRATLPLDAPHVPPSLSDPSLTPERATLTFKGPRREGPLKARDEIEINVDHAVRASALLAELGFVDRLVYEKVRESWRLGACRVDLDLLPRLGAYVEIEGPDESAVRRCLAALGAAAAALEPRDYPTLLAGEHSAAVEPIVICFEPGERP